MKSIGIYIHIPFCKKKCYYCDFVSFKEMENVQEKYINSLKKEIKKFIEINKDIKISTIYIGGGTPSYIDSKYIKEIMSLFKIEKDTEITIEINPGTVTLEKIKQYKDIGINRLSIGLQSTENTILKSIGRIHNYEDFLTTYDMAKTVGFNNINVDLMIGLPEQKIQQIKKALDAIIELKSNHISVYSLIVEEKTPIYQKIEKGELNLPDEDMERNMYWYVKNYLELNGYNHYEISNFSKLGFESKHNLDCWKQKEYRGFGVSAHSYIGGIRFSNTNNLQEYINTDGKNIQVQEIQTKYSMQQEYMLLGLRLIEGISIQKFKEKFGENPIIIFKRELNKLVNEELIQITDDKIKLTNKGLDLANLVWMEFV